ncbi:MAG: hypothetical protein QG656_49, partial [Candidatus Hydrogenedentes bacterium]|nr:hypothetical protein [Candidatus Hydrogenedentota bacterium]
MHKKPDPPYTPRPLKAYKNPAFLNSPDARTVRVLCEFTEPESRFRRLRVRHTVVFFGSARTLPPDVAEARLRELEANCVTPISSEGKCAIRIEQARRAVVMSRYYAEARDLAARLAKWSRSTHSPSNRFTMASGGGPGIMEAANRGAYDAGAHSVGMNISLPFEQFPNAYQSDELSFEFHYFFVRKFWFVHLAKAIVAFPGGYGTLDELVELLTLIQTGKTPRIPVVVYGSEYWNDVIDFDAMVKWGVIGPKDLG